MPYFSFSLKNGFDIDIFRDFNTINNINPFEIYFSKNTNLYKILNKKKNLHYLKKIEFERRKNINKVGKNILFCLPPSIGLGDAVEYAISIKSILLSKKFNSIGVAFVSKYKQIFKSFFNIKEIYEDIISINDFKKYDTIFHLTLEIKELNYQKYDRSNIEELITNYFKTIKYRKKFPLKKEKKNKITIFPISTSPLRTMPVEVINRIVKKFYLEKKIEIILVKDSEISSHIEKNIEIRNSNIKYPKNTNELISCIKNVQFGIFIDSGPLHIAKILNKDGVLISTSVSSKILLKGFSSIVALDNNYKSDFCNKSCGLVNYFNYNNQIGCYDSLKIKKKEILKTSNLNKLQRGSLKNNYINFISNPVNCVKNIEINKLIKLIEGML